MNTPLDYLWDGEGMMVLSRHQNAADQQFTIGQRYRLEVFEERSINSHNHQFAAIAETWSNLPDELAARYPTPEHLRKAALIATGWCDTHTLVCASKAEAIRVAAFMRPSDEFAVIVAKEATVTRYVAKSQSLRAMGKDDFTKSKSDVLDYVSALIGSTREQVTSNAGRAA